MSRCCLSFKNRLHFNERVLQDLSADLFDSNFEPAFEHFAKNQTMLIFKMRSRILIQTVAGLCFMLSLLCLGYVQTSLKAIVRFADFTIATCQPRYFISKAQEAKAKFATTNPPIMHQIETQDSGLDQSDSEALSKRSMLDRDFNSTD